MGGGATVFISVPSALIVLGVTIGTGMMAFGYADLARGLSALRAVALDLPDDVLEGRQIVVLRGLIPSVYAAGALGMTIGLVNLLVNLSDVSQTGPGMAVALLSMLYAAVLAEGVLRPGARCVETRLESSV